MNWKDMIENGDYDRFLELYHKRLGGGYMTKLETEEYEYLLDRYLI